MVEKRARPKIVKGNTHKVCVGCGNIYVTCNWDGENLIEIFAWLGKSGGCSHAQLEAITRAVSLGLKYGIPVEEYVEELKSIACPVLGYDVGEKILSCPDAIAGVLSNACKRDNPNKTS